MDSVGVVFKNLWNIPNSTGWPPVSIGAIYCYFFLLMNLLKHLWTKPTPPTAVPDPSGVAREWLREHARERVGELDRILVRTQPAAALTAAQWERLQQLFLESFGRIRDLKIGEGNGKEKTQRIQLERALVRDHIIREVLRPEQARVIGKLL